MDRRNLIKFSAATVAATALPAVAAALPTPEPVPPLDDYWFPRVGFLKFDWNVDHINRKNRIEAQRQTTDLVKKNVALFFDEHEPINMNEMHMFRLVHLEPALRDTLGGNRLLRDFYVECGETLNTPECVDTDTYGMRIYLAWPYYSSFTQLVFVSDPNNTGILRHLLYPSNTLHSSYPTKIAED